MKHIECCLKVISIFGFILTGQIFGQEGGEQKYGRPAIELEILLESLDSLFTSLPQKLQGIEVVYLKGADTGTDGLKARKEFITHLYSTYGFSVVLLPIGIFEGEWLNQRLVVGDSVKHAAQTTYKVWRENDEFLSLLRYGQTSQGDSIPLAFGGYMSRFHATSKALYPGYFKDMFRKLAVFDSTDALWDSIEKELGSRSRLSKTDDDARQRAKRVANAASEYLKKSNEAFVETFGARRFALEMQISKNMSHFIDLENHRVAGDVPDLFAEEEKARNLRWFLTEYYPTRKVIIWSGN